MGRRTLHLSELTGLLNSELRLVGELRDSLARQRAGVANDDRAAVEASVDEVGRIVSTLELARRRRVTLVGVITGDEGFPLERFEERASVPLPEGFLRARADLREAAQGAAVDASINHAVLRRAVEAGEGLLRGVFAPATDGSRKHTPGAQGVSNRAPARGRLT